MKNLNKLVSLLLIVFALAAFTSSCKKDYLKDGGVSNEKSTLSTYDYLQSNRYNYFDTTLLIIDHFNLKDSVNKAGTFFAFTDFAIQRLMVNSGFDNIDSMYAHTSSKLITQYLFSNNGITLKDAVLTPVEYTSWAGGSEKYAVNKVPGTYNINLVNTSPSFGYFTLEFITVNGELDGAANVPPGDPVDIFTLCQTSDIYTATGTLHVLANTALIKLR